MNFMDFIVGFELSGSTESFSNKEKEKSTAESSVYWIKCDNMCKDDENFITNLLKKNQKMHHESLKAEKKCECKCKNQPDFYEGLLRLFAECEKMMREGVSEKTLIHFMSTFFDIEERLRSEIEKSDTAKSCQCAEKDCTYYIRNGTYYMPKQMSYAEWKKRLTDDEINEALENGIRGDQIIYLPKTEKEKIIKLIDKCFEIIDKQSDADFIRIKEHLVDMLCVLVQYR